MGQAQSQLRKAATRSAPGFLAQAAASVTTVTAVLSNCRHACCRLAVQAVNPAVKGVPWPSRISGKSRRAIRNQTRSLTSRADSQTARMTRRSSNDTFHKPPTGRTVCGPLSVAWQNRKWHPVVPSMSR